MPPEVKQKQLIKVSDFLVRRPPSVRAVAVGPIGRTRTTGYGRNIQIITPDINLYCSSRQCNGIRTYTCVATKGGILTSDKPSQVFLTYQCKNCEDSTKVFALLVKLDKEPYGKPGIFFSGEAIKLGEYPGFGPGVPARVLRLLQPDKDLFLQGWRAEKQGMGIGAFAYYRRVVENQKTRIFDSIIKAARKEGADDELLSELEAAKEEIQFSKAVESIKIALPAALNINGHNPLTLLHRALSQGLHAESDEDCLEAASAVRLVLIEMVERIAHVSAERAELDAAVSRLLKRTDGTRESDNSG